MFCITPYGGPQTFYYAHFISEGHTLRCLLGFPQMSESWRQIHVASLVVSCVLPSLLPPLSKGQTPNETQTLQEETKLEENSEGQRLWLALACLWRIRQPGQVSKESVNVVMMVKASWHGIFLLLIVEQCGEWPKDLGRRVRAEPWAEEQRQELMSLQTQSSAFSWSSWRNWFIHRDFCQTLFWKPVLSARAVFIAACCVLASPRNQTRCFSSARSPDRPGCSASWVAAGHTVLGTDSLHLYFHYRRAEAAWHLCRHSLVLTTMGLHILSMHPHLSWVRLSLQYYVTIASISPQVLSP